MRQESTVMYSKLKYLLDSERQLGTRTKFYQWTLNVFPRSVGLPHSSFLAHYNKSDCFQLHFNWLLFVFFLMLKEIFGSVYIHPHTFLGYYVANSTCAIPLLIFPLWQSIMLFPSVPSVWPFYSVSFSLCIYQWWWFDGMVSIIFKTSGSKMLLIRSQATVFVLVFAFVLR